MSSLPFEENAPLRIIDLGTGTGALAERVLDRFPNCHLTLVDMTETVVAEGVVADAGLADIGVILGTGFAPFLGGPLKARKDGTA